MCMSNDDAKRQHELVDLLADQADVAVDLSAQGSAFGLQGIMTPHLRPAQGDQDRHALFFTPSAGQTPAKAGGGFP